MTPSGRLYIPEVAKGRSEQGIVAYVGSGVNEDIKPGDHILFSGYVGTTLRVDRIIYIIVPVEFVTAKLETSDHDVYGLYFRDNQGNYFTATRDMAYRLIADAAQDKQQSDGTVVSERGRPAPDSGAYDNGNRKT